MKPQIRLIDGLHLTATDKRNLLAVIEYERASAPEIWGTRWLGLAKSPKSYAVSPDPEKPGRYVALIRTREKNDRGEPKVRQSTVIFETENVKPLPHPAYQTQDLFAPKSWEIEA